MPGPAAGQFSPRCGAPRMSTTACHRAGAAKAPRYASGAAGAHPMRWPTSMPARHVSEWKSSVNRLCARMGARRSMVRRGRHGRAGRLHFAGSIAVTIVFATAASLVRRQAHLVAGLHVLQRGLILAENDSGAWAACPGFLISQRLSVILPWAWSRPLADFALGQRGLRRWRCQREGPAGRRQCVASWRTPLVGQEAKTRLSPDFRTSIGVIEDRACRHRPHRPCREIDRHARHLLRPSAWDLCLKQAADVSAGTPPSTAYPPTSPVWQDPSAASMPSTRAIFGMFPLSWTFTAKPWFLQVLHPVLAAAAVRSPSDLNQHLPQATLGQAGQRRCGRRRAAGRGASRRSSLVSPPGCDDDGPDHAGHQAVAGNEASPRWKVPAAVEVPDDLAFRGHGLTWAM